MEAQLTTITSSGEAILMQTSTGKSNVVSGGLANDTMNIFGSMGFNADAIRAFDCGNGTGEHCVLIFDR